MSIVSRLINRPDSYSIEMLQRGVQTGTIPPYIGIPLIEEKLREKKAAQGAQALSMAGQKPPTVAEQVMSQASQASAIDSLKTNLPTSYAGGGIVSFADGGSLFDDEEDEKDEYERSVSSLMESMDALQERAMALRGGGEEVAMAAPLMATERSEGVSFKRSGEPAKTVERTEKSVSKPAGLEELLAMVMQKESGGRRYDKEGNLLTSPKGAMGEMQVMPGTARDPGFGIRPAREGDAEDLARVGREYFARMLERYGDPKLAAVAYNWGPGNTDKWIMAGADPKKLPEETRNYIKGFAEGGVVALQTGGMPDIFSMTPEEIAEERRRELKREAARATFSSMPEEKAKPASTSKAPDKLSEKVGKGAGRFVQSLIGSPAARAAGIFGLMAPTNAAEETGRQQEAELARRRAMAPTVDVPPGVLLSEFPGVQQQAGAPPRMEKPQPTTQTYVRPQGGATASELAQFMREADVSAAREREDLDLAQAMQAMGAQPPDVAKAPEAPKEAESMSSLRKYIEESRAGLKKQKDIDTYMALLQAGFGMMGGQSPFASQNIGRGAMAGVQAYQEAARGRAADQRALLQAELGLERYGQLGALQREQMGLRRQLSEAETERKREADVAKSAQARASLEERTRKNYADQLNEVRRLAQQQALAQYKGALLPDQKEQVLAQAEVSLMADPAYRQLYKRVYGFEPGGGVKSYDPASRSLR